ncbi:DNA ligase [Helicobacter sp. 23-1045]
MKKFLVFLAIFGRIFALDSADSDLRFANLDSLKFLKNAESYAVSEKFDGVRGIWDGQTMFSKRGKKFAIPPCFAQNLAVLGLQKGEFVEGELWIDYGEFEKISALIRQKSPSCADFKQVKYLIFNAKLNESSDFLANLSTIQSILDSHKIAQIRTIKQYKFSDTSEVGDFFNAIIAKGGEGVILRNSHIALKLKARHDAECKIIDFTRGKGRLSDKVGAIVCESLADKNSGISKGTIFRIGSGLSDEMRANPPKIGTIITYQFSGISKNGVPKHTRFLRIYGD